MSYMQPMHPHALMKCQTLVVVVCPTQWQHRLHLQEEIVGKIKVWRTAAATTAAAAAATTTATTTTAATATAANQSNEC